MIIDGKALADQKAIELKAKVSELKAIGITPGLVVILVGEDSASQVYVRNKERRANDAGFLSTVVRLPETTTQAELLAIIEQYNHDTRYHGILVQLPVPKQIDADKVLLAIKPEKDVDGFHPMNVGLLNVGNPLMIPSTPAGIMEMLKAYQVDLSGKNAVVIGRSNIVGKPIAQLLLAANATVTLAHSRTKNLAEIARQADILVVAIGQGHFVTKEFVKEGAVVIDVGMNRDENGKLIGDVKFDEIEPIASLITPVPGGVGPMTITMLMEQTFDAAKKAEMAD
ncbi:MULTISPECIES: bifunctional methylenetetrahydrofolate dehydrogenase/methenyltetrahydrofolate cyclohydrolase [unclassified Enterococcus]|uniref:bifunctional methylenetetrahydrofolate dehydrogenase/methenyltetrahydrofolate cyclohydrolase n=1 Tax=unclassified Enterococcus TaxID=2608891 RepID=UPI001557D6AC|nr:bifunctional methylenetetrahydrofolate dehydrogenase/methenyltetrahydrofolate cyclohydrolase [Enterococcus sp. MMGLQ5-2]MBS7583218.1 bifunctional methylenetetrahydrofolate dehydrogenase/methenyltetrahydrofolate cyclohydrolase [Enterococcus sp. MMGLQ5-1]NPD11078.1 bifunctional methylenetetrahydrofolate dehydrogenase/methenyltetrahydrofolate cyclohydrolase [Enterococcus sp. MMGLQ5-1]NPD35821.1 bifunctional methylenetetrahydrofolate dehydrogenase/methenyltetrahydrofolate cyclohydrolase [Enteroco